jgi:hypothetical protein
MILCLLQVILVRVGDVVSSEDGEKIVKLIILIFQSLKKVSQHGLLAYGGLCQGLKERVNVNDFGKYILWALQGDDDDCARVACGLVSDIATALGEQVNIYLTSFVPPLLQMLSAVDKDRHTKLAALMSLGDLAINAPKSYCQSYLGDTMQILYPAGELSLKREEYKDDQDVLDYLSDLRTSILNCYSTITSGAKDSG